MTITTSIPDKARGRIAKSISLGFTDIWFSPSRWQMLVLDLVLVFLLFQTSVWLSPYKRWGQWSTDFIASGAIYTFFFAFFSLGSGAYDRVRRFDYSNIIRLSLSASLLALVITLAYVYFIFYDVVGRLTLLYATAGSFLGSLVTHLALAFVLRRNPYRFTIVGSSKYLDEIVAFCGSDLKQARLYVYTPWDRIFPGGSEYSEDRLLSSRVGDIVVSSESLNDPAVIDMAIQALKAKFRVVDEVEFYTQIFERYPVDVISKAWVLREGLAKRQVLTLALKRWLDIVLSGVALILLAPLMLGIVGIIKLSSPGPAIFTQERQGRYLKRFRMYKFRTMRVVHDGTQDVEFTREQDDRVTFAGRLLRPLHLDELPQLWNIFTGDMSIVGPRPETISFAETMRRAVSLYELRYLVRPGLTGHAQIRQGYATNSVEATKTKLAYDLYYLCNHNLWTDLVIIMQTVFFLAKNAR